VVLRGTGPQLNPTWWTPKRCADLEVSDPVAHRCDVLGEFSDPEQGLLNPIAVRRSVRATPLELPPDFDGSFYAAVDPSEGLAGGNGFSLCIVERFTPTPATTLWGQTWNQHTDGRQKFRVALVREWRGYRPGQCWQEIAKVCRLYRIGTAVTDQYAAAANADLARHYGLDLRVDRATADSKLADFTDLATLLHEDRIELSPDPVLSRDLLSVKRRVTQGTAKIVLPRTGDGRHADYASALCAAIKRANKCEPLRAVHFKGI
jgi:hypothetical protein